jgi:hypothetical protein
MDTARKTETQKTVSLRYALRVGEIDVLLLAMAGY